MEQLELFDEENVKRYWELEDQKIELNLKLREIEKSIEELKSKCSCKELTKTYRYHTGNEYELPTREYYDVCRFCGKEYNNEIKSSVWYQFT